MGMFKNLTAALALLLLPPVLCDTARAQANPFGGNFLSVVDYLGKPALIVVNLGGIQVYGTMASFDPAPPTTSWTILAYGAIDTRPCAQNLIQGPALTNTNGNAIGPYFPAFPRLTGGFLTVTGLSIPIGTVACSNSQFSRCYIYSSYCQKQCWGCNGGQIDSPEVSVIVVRP
jgi:hypothetical protein